jgi:hypothetical protein
MALHAFASSGTSGTIEVRTEEDAVVLIYRVRSLLATEWKAVEQRVPITGRLVSAAYSSK